MYQMITKYTKRPLNMSNNHKNAKPFLFQVPRKISPIWEFWYENILSGNLGMQDYQNDDKTRLTHFAIPIFEANDHL
jgi:hypothetical protein